MLPRHAVEPENLKLIKMKICKECGNSFGGVNVFGMSKYCSVSCKKKVRDRVNMTCKERAKQKVLHRDTDFIALSYFKKYKQRSPSRKLEFTLTLDFFKKHVYAPCYYCGEEIKAVGFDRLDNSIGYTEENSVPCCVDCNFMKRTLSVERFVELCRKISNNQNL